MNEALAKSLSTVTDALPEHAKPLVQALLEGRVKQFVIVLEQDDGKIMDAFPILTGDANRMAMIGALEIVKRDYMRQEIEARIEYQRIEDEP